MHVSLFFVYHNIILRDNLRIALCFSDPDTTEKLTMKWRDEKPLEFGSTRKGEMRTPDFILKLLIKPDAIEKKPKPGMYKINRNT